MPTSLPPLLLIRRLAQQTFFASLFGIRAILIAFVWLGLLPWITIWTWRVYFTMGESTYVTCCVSQFQHTKNYPARGGLVVVRGPQMFDLSESSKP